MSDEFVVRNENILHSGMFHPTLRTWQGLQCNIGPENFMYPVFIVEENNAIQPIDSMPGISRFGVDSLKQHLQPLIAKGLKSILLFGVINTLTKDDNATHADSPQNPVIKALPKLLEWFPDLIIACDVCLCPYTSHGHCGMFNNDGSLDNTSSIRRISKIALNYAKAGAHIVAPSDMMDGRIGAIKTELVNNGLGNKVAVLSYTAKFASNFYGPFRDAAKSKPAYGDRKCYQLPAGGAGLALRAAERDVSEGADMLMVKPVMIYMDLVRQIKDKYPERPMFVYQVSGEYSMIYNASVKGTFDLRLGLMEIFSSLRRAGADVIISYFTPLVLHWMSQPKNKL
ncbi:unnamed protein product [Phyllotreta striolata]|uniref:Delta-aminolevulinic acid dehydratase n=1 Tax=Phyllotreta striolata TaxID=444603 RepID=A0A9N9TVK6_PHYSR|nr:unnamed protein product [Phyllotreta striolata]